MSKFVLCVIAAVIAVLALTASASYTEDSLRSEFGAFILKYEQNYATAEEYESRFQIFKANVLHTEQLNKQSKTATFGITKFSAMTQKEREEFLGKLPTNRRNAFNTRPAIEKTNLFAAKSFDIVKDGMIHPVKDQGNCGSCWAFSTVAGISSTALKAGVDPKIANNLSTQQVVDCTPDCYKCNGGDLPQAYNYLSRFGGIQSEASYPYTARDGTCKNNATAVVVPVKGFQFVIPQCDTGDCDKVDTQSFLTQVGTKGIAPAICVYVSNAWFDYTGGVFDLPCTSDYYKLNHCIAMVGYSAEQGYVTVQNSWGTSWGDQGFMKLKYDAQTPNLCGIFSEGAFALIN